MSDAPPPSDALVLFGATGDLAKKKIFPAVYEMARLGENHVPIIVARSLPDTERFGRLQTDGGRVTGFFAKGVKGPGLINGGCYVFGADELAALPPGQAFSIETDYFPKQVAVRRFDYFLTEGQFIDIGVPDDYKRAQIELAGVCQ